MLRIATIAKEYQLPRGILSQDRLPAAKGRKRWYELRVGVH